ncbi:MAG: VIT1/CCC1 transporter family protein [Candidatus Bathyarchaeota archaeon]|nr:VIT1/CCC1 transporter family protein [Candidatus Bathyarchaeota archaeon]
MLEDIGKSILKAQKNEITEHYVYRRLAQSMRDPNNRSVLERISNEEFKHYKFWREYTLRDIKPSRLIIWKYFLISKVFGITFGIKLMERGEKKAQAIYEKISETIPEAYSIVEDEDSHERELTGLIDEERLRYVSSIVLGLNDALVELTGALAGFTLALQKARLVAIMGLITGISGALSMATSEYLSTKSEGSAKNPIRAAAYTGITYVFTVLFLILPYVFLVDIYACISLSLINAIVLIFLFTFYVSVAKDLHFKRRFLEMSVISLGIACLTFLIGFLIRIFLNIEV